VGAVAIIDEIIGLDTCVDVEMSDVKLIIGILVVGHWSFGIRSSVIEAVGPFSGMHGDLLGESEVSVNTQEEDDGIQLSGSESRGWKSTNGAPKKHVSRPVHLERYEDWSRMIQSEGGEWESLNRAC
jgi:hypothetical protein